MDEVEQWCFYDTYVQELIDFTLLLVARGAVPPAAYGLSH